MHNIGLFLLCYINPPTHPLKQKVLPPPLQENPNPPPPLPAHFLPPSRRPPPTVPKYAGIGGIASKTFAHHTYTGVLVCLPIGLASASVSLSVFRGINVIESLLDPLPSSSAVAAAGGGGGGGSRSHVQCAAACLKDAQCQGFRFDRERARIIFKVWP